MPQLRVVAEPFGFLARRIIEKLRVLISPVPMWISPPLTQTVPLSPTKTVGALTETDEPAWTFTEVPPPRSAVTPP